jgi:hypothetical protein
LQRPLKSLLPIEGLLYATTMVQVAISDLIAHFLKLRDQRSRRSFQDKLHPALDLWLGIKIHGTRLLSIRGNNNNLFLPIRMANPRQTNQDTI